MPESCLWGAEADNRRDEAVRKGTNGIIVSEDGSRSVGVLQWEYRQGEGINVAYLLVGLVREEGAKGRDKAVWSKWFWPVDPIKMWRAFRQLYANLAVERRQDRHARNMIPRNSKSSGTRPRRSALLRASTNPPVQASRGAMWSVT